MMRDKRRYLVVESYTAVGEPELFQRKLMSSLLQVVGESNFFKLNPKIVKFIDDRRFIIRTSLEGMRYMVLALSFITKMDGADTAFYTLGASGTILAIEKKLQK
ncbi:MAG TPA: Rpp14/Pop5 family protein [Candidatus Baltobacteraceae bacterium]|nr:Rpp14/Pop5 family protein [Candidatus Baltobacteraceae bacterium]